MAYLNSARKQLNGIIPEPTNSPVVHTDLAGIVNAIEARIVQRAASVVAASDGTTGFLPFEAGMLLVTTGGTAPGLFGYHTGSWKRFFPTITSSAGAPSGGEDGDIHLQY